MIHKYIFHQRYIQHKKKLWGHMNEIDAWMLKFEGRQKTHFFLSCSQASEILLNYKVSKNSKILFMIIADGVKLWRIGSAVPNDKTR